MADKVACPECGFEMETAGESADGRGICASCGKEIAAEPPNDNSSVSQPRRDRRGCGCLLWILILGPIGFVLLGIFSVYTHEMVREPTRRTACARRLKQINVALQSYRDEYGRFPPPYTVDENGNRLHSWRTLILPYMKEEKLVEQIRLDEPWDSEHNHQFASYEIGAYHCPCSGFKTADLGFVTDYVMITGPGTVGECLDGTRLEDITDAHDTTVVIAEVLQSNVNWMEPRDYDFAAGPHHLVAAPKGPIGPTDLSSYHWGVVNMLMVDGSVKSVPVDIDEKAFKALMTIRGGEEVELE